LALGPALHWGAIATPATETRVEYGFQILAFTAYGKAEEGRGVPGWQQFNAARSSFGVNALSYSSAHPLRRLALKRSSLLYTSTLLAGVNSDAPAYALQNKFVHRLARLRYVPRGGDELAPLQRPVVEYGGALNLFPKGEGVSESGSVHVTPSHLFVGAGFDVGTLLQDAFVQIGLAQFVLNEDTGWEDTVEVSLSALARGGVVLPASTVFAWSELAPAYAAAQGSVRATVWRNCFPVSVEVALTSSSGLLAYSSTTYAAPASTGTMTPPARRGGGIPMSFVSVRLQFLRWFTFETYNDLIGDTDIGPSFGARISAVWAL